MADNGCFWPKTRYFKGQNVLNLAEMGQDGKSLMKYNKLDHLNGIMSQKSSKNLVHFLEAMLECAYHLDISVISLTPWGKTHNFDL